ncbi:MULTISPECIES: glycosyltransferase family 2 protein [unclassified Thermoanaerobacterium]|uniref:glycosyltransferase n=1 Tax=unclassified Thermoanaerobacterium TaxID=2622527 RepID=UPI000A1615DC|nr:MULTISPECIES: glycosyltransferase family 2 protein [unclassified Thermoanaerobacterium]MDE4543498.1 glycosyltransferase family 2 protein [Thermoanaerobacterium sp. R66]ORX23850.1 glycosyl transferase family 2 [Thermoanaerobacterium sp. PSU-2]
MIVSAFLFLGIISGFVLFRNLKVPYDNQPLEKQYKISVIIPARNEEKNLPYILESLKNQTYMPYEVIVVDDFSSDRTFEIAESYGVKVMKNTEMPDGWTGKTWALWNGYKNSTGDVFAFIDADVRLSPRALESLAKAREKVNGAISVVPYHSPEKFYEKLSLIPYILGIFAFTSPFEKYNPRKGMYGSCIVVSREDYEKVNGHHSIKGELLDDLNLGERFTSNGINVQNFIGYDLISFRMYPYGIKSEVEGFGKGAILSTSKLEVMTTIFIALWLIGLLAVEFITPFLAFYKSDLFGLFLVLYIMYTLQIIYIDNWTGRYGIIVPLFHILSSLFFIYIMFYSLYQVFFLGYVTWKGRRIKV